MRITKLDGLRGVFCLLVVLFHYSQNDLPKILYESFLIRESWMFVEFFFVLSGFVISYNYESLETKGELKIYLVKRFNRLYPLLFYSTIIFLFIEILMNTFFVEFINTPETINSLIYKTIDTLTFMNSTPVFGNSLGMNYPSWSISSEMISYVVFGLVTVFIQKRETPRYYLLLILFSIVIMLNKSLFFQGIHLDFVRGILSSSLGVLIQKFPFQKLKIPNYTEFIIPIMIVGSMFLLNRTTGVIREFHSVITINIVFFLSIHVFLKTKGVLTKILESSLIQFLGKISYSVYLNHCLLIIIIPRFLFNILGLERTIFNMICILTLTLVILILYSNFTYKIIESLGGKYLKKLLLRK